MTKRILLAAGGVAGFAIVVYAAGLDRLPALLDADPGWTAAAFATLVAVTLVSTVRWAQLGNHLAGRALMRFSEYYAALLTSRVLGLFVSRSASDLGVRFAAMTASRRAPAKVAAASLFLDQMFDLALLVAWVAPSLAILAGDIPFGVGTAVLVAVSALALLAMVHLHWVLTRTVQALGWSVGALARLPTPASVRRFLDARRRNILSLLEVEHLTRRRLLRLGILTFVRYLLNAFMFFAVARALGLPIGWGVFLLSGALVQLSLVLAATPGGLGVMDAGWVLALAAGGVPASTAAAFLVAQRAFQYLAFPALGAASHLLMLPRRRRRTGSSPPPTDPGGGGDGEASQTPVVGR